MQKLLWAEHQKIRRSKIVWITVFAVVLLAVMIFAGGLDVYHGPVVGDGLKYVRNNLRYIDNAGWYMDEVQPWSVMFVFPAVTALFGSYMICREEDEDTIKSLRLIPINEVKLTVAKMIVTFELSVMLYLLLFMITFLTEAVLHFSDLSVKLVLVTLKEYVLEGIGIFFAVSPVIALASRMKKYWLALVLAEIYSIAGLFVSMTSTLKYFYPINVVFNFSGYYKESAVGIWGSMGILLLCGALSVLILKLPGKTTDSRNTDLQQNTGLLH